MLTYSDAEMRELVENSPDPESKMYIDKLRENSQRYFEQFMSSHTSPLVFFVGGEKIVF